MLMRPTSRARTRRRRVLESVPLEEIGAIQGHHIQGLAERALFLVDGQLAVLCTPLEYRLALQLLRAGSDHPVREQRLRAVLSLDRRSLWKLVTILRHKLFVPLGLEVVTIPRYGYLLLEREEEERETATPSWGSVSPASDSEG
jgi:biotin operon repressor